MEYLERKKCPTIEVVFVFKTIEIDKILEKFYSLVLGS